MKDASVLTSSRKNGFILIYTLLICSLCILIAVYFFSMEFKKMENIISYKKSITKDNKLDEYKEHLFTILYQNMPAEIRNSSTDNVKNYFQQNNTIYNYDNSYSKIKYDAARNKIILQSYYDEYYHRDDLYDYKVLGGKLKFIYIQTLYVEGRLV